MRITVLHVAPERSVTVQRCSVTLSDGRRVEVPLDLIHVEDGRFSIDPTELGFTPPPVSFQLEGMEF